jgi:hypothetical protein
MWQGAARGWGRHAGGCITTSTLPTMQHVLLSAATADGAVCAQQLTAACAEGCSSPCLLSSMYSMLLASSRSIWSTYQRMPYPPAISNTAMTSGRSSVEEAPMSLLCAVTCAGQLSRLHVSKPVHVRVCL